jgi:hypothetical protein
VLPNRRPGEARQFLQLVVGHAVLFENQREDIERATGPFVAYLRENRESEIVVVSTKVIAPTIERGILANRCVLSEVVRIGD